MNESSDSSPVVSYPKTSCEPSVEYRFEVYYGKTGLTAIRDSWNQIVQALDNLRFFQCYEWYESYLDTLAESDSSVCFVLVKRGSSPVGVIPFVQSTLKIASLRFRSLELIHHSHMPLSDGVFARSDQYGAIIERLIAYLRHQSEIEWDVVFFPNLLEDGCIRQALKAASIPWSISETHTRCNYIHCTSFDELSKKFSKNFRGNLRKARNKLMNLSGVEYISVRQSPQLDQALNDFLKVEASGWKGVTGESSAIELDVPLTNFYRSLCETFSRIDGCEINLLKANGHCLAGQFCLVVQDTSYILKIGYDESYGHVAPGNMLLEHSLRRYWREGVVKYLNLVTDMPWHADWKPHSYTVMNAHVLNKIPAGMLAFALLHYKKYLRGTYKSRLKPLVERLRKILHDRSADKGLGRTPSFCNQRSIPEGHKNELSVSVIIPTYNRAKHIVQSLRSVLAAIAPGDEVIVVDDGSTDNTRQELEPYRDRIRYVMGPHRGAGAARNCGIAEARHPLVAFNDSDDEWFPDKLALQRAFMQARPDVLFCFSDIGLKDKNGTKHRHGLFGWHRDPRSWDEILGPGAAYSSIAALPPGREDFNVHIGSLYETMLRVGYVPAQTSIVRREQAGDALYFSEDLNVFEDHECFTRLARIGKAAYFDCETAWQCDHEGQRLTQADSFYRATCHITMLQRTFGVDEQFLSQHKEHYRGALKDEYLARARYLMRNGQREKAREELRLADGGPLAYRLLTAMPAPLLRGILVTYQFIHELIEGLSLSL